MKKFISVIMALLLAVSGTACTSKTASDEKKADKGTEQTQKAEEKKEKATEESNVLENDEALIKYVGSEKAKKSLCDDYEGMHLLKFEYSNKTSEPKQCYSLFDIKVFQDGVEVGESSSAYSGEAEQQYKLVGNYTLETMEGGTLTFARRYVLDPEKDATVFIEEKSKERNKVKFTIKADELRGPVITESVEVIKEHLQGSWVLAGQTMTFSGDKFSMGADIVGTYTIVPEEALVKVAIISSDRKKVSFEIPITFENGVLKVYNNNNEELTKQ